MDRVARIISDHMVMSKKVSPTLQLLSKPTSPVSVKWRNRTKDAFFKREGVALTFMPAIAEATAERHWLNSPHVNASVDGYKVILKKAY